MVSFTETFQNVDKLHVGGYVNLDKLQGGLMLSGRCSKEPVIFLEQFTTQWKVSAKGENCQRFPLYPFQLDCLKYLCPIC